MSCPRTSSAFSMTFPRSTSGWIRRSNLVYEENPANCRFRLSAFPRENAADRGAPFQQRSPGADRAPHHPCQARRGGCEGPAGQRFIGFDPDIPPAKASTRFFATTSSDRPVMESNNIETVKPRWKRPWRGDRPQPPSCRRPAKGTWSSCPSRPGIHASPGDPHARPGAGPRREEIRRNPGPGPPEARNA